jgi:predicted nucleic acid-binding protein
LTRYLLDTNVISNITKAEPSQSLLEWMGVQSDGDLFISSLTVAEIRRGILDKPRGKNAIDWRRGLPDQRVRSRYSKEEYYHSTRRRHWSGLVLCLKVAPSGNPEATWI